MSNNSHPTVGFVITNPLTGRPIQETPDGILIENKVFPTMQELEEFVAEHWNNAVFCAESIE